jgi:hypothetical protein
MIDPKHLLDYVIQPVLKDLDLWSAPAERLLLGTACQESACGQYLVQLGNVKGGGLGIYQMEHETHQDIWLNFLNAGKRLSLIEKISNWTDEFDSDKMIGNLYYATAMCRVHYLRDPKPIPHFLFEQAQYWKRVYDTEKGAGTVQNYMNNWNRFVSPGD